MEEMTESFILSILSTASLTGFGIIFLLVVAKPLMPVVKDWFKGRLFARGVILNESNHYGEIRDELRKIAEELKGIKEESIQHSQKLDKLVSDTLIIKDRTGR